MIDNIEIQSNLFKSNFEKSKISITPIKSHFAAHFYKAPIENQLFKSNI